MNIKVFAMYATISLQKIKHWVEAQAIVQFTEGNASPLQITICMSSLSILSVSVIS